MGGLGLAGMLAMSRASAAPPIPYATTWTPGTASETAFLVKLAGTTIMDGGRSAAPGQFLVYGVPVLPNATCRLNLVYGGAAPPTITVLDAKSQPLPARISRDADGSLSILWTVPPTWTPGARQSVRISAKPAAFRLTQVRFVQVDADGNNDGLPDGVAALMQQGTVGKSALQVFPPPAQPLTITQTPLAPDPTIDLQTDAVFLYGTDANAIAYWKARGYTVWTMGGARDGKEYADKNPDEVQTDASGNKIAIGQSYYLAPTANRIAVERDFYAKALASGSDGICPEEPEYWLRAGYETAFKTAWQTQYGSPWQAPNSSIDARTKAAKLMATMQTRHISDLLADAAQRKSNARRLVALHSPLSYAQWGVVSPQYRITSLPAVQEVIGQVWTGTARTPARYAGIRTDRTFSVAYLEYSSLFQLLRGTNKKLWFLLDPLEDNLSLSAEDYKTHYEETLIAALLFPDVSAYEVMPWPERVYGKVASEYATQINAVNAVLQDMNGQVVKGGNGTPGDMGVFLSDSLQYQREAPNASDFDGVFGLSLPLLQRGVPVQMLSLDRAADAGYLRNFKTLLLSYDFLKPENPRVHSALAAWVKDGGSLMVFGGSDADNAVADSWWKRVGKETPTLDLWEKLGINAGTQVTTRRVTADDGSGYTNLLSAEATERNLGNRRTYTLDLTPFVTATGSVAVRFADVSPSDGWGAWVSQADLKINGKTAASFLTGSEIENRFLAADSGSQFSGAARFADASAAWVYQFDNLPRNGSVTLSVEMGNGFQVGAKSVQPDFGNTILGYTDTSEIARTLPRLRIGAAYPVTLYPQMNFPTASAKPAAVTNGQAAKDEEAPIPLYALRAGGVPVWAQTVGKGLVVNVGIAPGYFSSSERSAGLLRALTQYAHQKAGGVYREPGYLQIKRGRYTVLRTFSEPRTVEGRTIDLLASNLPVAVDRVIPPRSLALLVDLPAGGTQPRIGFTSGRTVAKLETATTTALFVRAPLNTVGVTRIHAAGRSLDAARAVDRLGRPVNLQAAEEGDSLLLRYPNHPDGVVLRIGWR
jgi:hypothetical protein